MTRCIFAEYASAIIQSGPQYLPELSYLVPIVRSAQHRALAMNKTHRTCNPAKLHWNIAPGKITRRGLWCRCKVVPEAGVEPASPEGGGF